ncbi:MAG: hypothetical protein LUG50_03575, partial [Planctomycetaceae bacterium]|nr:hypothetical protein [Planctomycetaceae bacterium]
VTTIESGAILEVTGGGLHLFSEAESPDPVRIIHGSHFADDTLFTLVSRSIGLSIRQEILADGYYLYLGKTAPDFVDLLQGYGTPNARRAAAAFTDIVARGDGHLTGGLYGYIASLPNDPARIADAFQQVHGKCSPPARMRSSACTGPSATPPAGPGRRRSSSAAPAPA